MNLKNLLMGYHFFNPSSPTNDLLMDGLFNENMTSSLTGREMAGKVTWIPVLCGRRQPVDNTQGSKLEN